MSKTSQWPNPTDNNPPYDNNTWLGSALDIDIDASLRPKPAIYDVVGRLYRFGARANL